MSQDLFSDDLSGIDLVHDDLIELSQSQDQDKSDSAYTESLSADLSSSDSLTSAQSQVGHRINCCHEMTIFVS